jgi:hypothetical protein
VSADAGADRPPADSPGQLFIGPPETRYLVTTPDVVKEAMALYKLVLRQRDARMMLDEAVRALMAADDAHRKADEDLQVARAELRRAIERCQ